MKDVARRIKVWRLNWTYRWERDLRCRDYYDYRSIGAPIWEVDSSVWRRSDICCSNGENNASNSAAVLGAAVGMPYMVWGLARASRTPFIMHWFSSLLDFCDVGSGSEGVARASWCSSGFATNCNDAGDVIVSLVCCGEVLCVCDWEIGEIAKGSGVRVVVSDGDEVWFSWFRWWIQLITSCSTAPLLASKVVQVFSSSGDGWSWLLARIVRCWIADGVKDGKPIQMIFF